MKLPNGDGRRVVMGETVTVDGPIELCRRGLHASRNPLDALSYRDSPIFVRVELSGEIQEANDKLCATSRKHLWAVDATKILHIFACRCAEQAMTDCALTDERSWNAVRVKRAWIDGKATDADLAAASAAASAAAWAAASAAESAAERDAASAAESAAERDAASAAASAAAWAAAWARQNLTLSNMLIRAHKEQVNGM
jgi:hypothetical protein